MNATSSREACSRMPQVGRPHRPIGRGAEFGAQKHAAKSPQRPRVAALIGLALPLAVLVAGCQERLAQRDAYFAPLSGLSVSLHAETEHLVDYHRALQAARLGCIGSHRAAASPDDEGLGGVWAGGAGRDGARSELCGSSGMTHGAHGAPLNGYRRWVGDKVRPLPAPSETAASIGGGS